jgi:hypothetical protein
MNTFHSTLSCFYQKENLFLWLNNQALRYENIRGSEHTDTTFLDFGTSWRRVISFTPQPFYSRVKIPPVAGRAVPISGLDDMEKWKFLTLPRLELRLLGRPACSQSLCRYTDCATICILSSHYPPISIYVFLVISFLCECSFPPTHATWSSLAWPMYYVWRRAQVTKLVLNLCLFYSYPLFDLIYNSWLRYCGF